MTDAKPHPIAIATTSSDPEEARLLGAARRGDAKAFEALARRHRGALHAHCYRLLGSLHDADDALQETLVSAWQNLSGFEGRSALRTWLFTIATRAALRIAEQRRVRVLSPALGGQGDPLGELPAPFDDGLFVEPYPDRRFGLGDDRSPEARYEERESVELAFVAALQNLPPSQRAVLVLRDVLGMSADETAAALATSVAAANSALARARTTLDARALPRSQAANRRALGDARLGALVERFVSAWGRADVDAIVTMLAEDATFTMPPLPLWFRGREDIAAFLRTRVFALRWRFAVTSINGQPAMAAYLFDEARGEYVLDVVNVLSFHDAQVVAIDAFLGRPIVSQLGLPETVADAR